MWLHFSDRFSFGSKMAATVPSIMYRYNHIQCVCKTLLQEVNAVNQPNAPAALERIKNTTDTGQNKEHCKQSKKKVMI